MKNNELLILTTSSKVKHLKKINKKMGICSSETGAVTKCLFDVDCPKCLDIVVKKRLTEITAIEQAKQNNSCVNETIKLKPIETVIRL